MATDYRDDTLSADRYTVLDTPASTPAKETRMPATYTGTNVNHPRFPQFRKDMTAAQKRAHTKAGRPRKTVAASVAIARAQVASTKPVAVKAAPALTNGEVVKAFRAPMPGLSKKSATLIAAMLATPANVSVSAWDVLREVAATPSKFDLLTLRAALGVAAPAKARKAA